jgi:hypothetical protein
MAQVTSSWMTKMSSILHAEHLDRPDDVLDALLTELFERGIEAVANLIAHGGRDAPRHPRWISAAHCTASAMLWNSTSMPSPVVLMTGAGKGRCRARPCRVYDAQ